MLFVSENGDIKRRLYFEHDIDKKISEADSGEKTPTTIICESYQEYELLTSIHYKNGQYKGHKITKITEDNNGINEEARRWLKDNSR